MNRKISDILDRMKALESELEKELETRRQNFRYTLDNHKVHFERDILAQQRKLRIGLLRYIFTARPLHVLTAPVIYAVFIPLVLLDIMVTLYQTICFPVYGIPRIKRKDYLVYDRHHLAYLNLLEKINCYYCSYANGLIPYFAEVIGRTEQYWCPIKHAERVRGAHSRYQLFSEYGDAEGFRRDLEKIRKDFDE